MRDGIYIRPAIVRLAVLALVLLTARMMRSQLPVARRYYRFETM